MTRFLLDSNAVNALINSHQPLTRRARDAASRGSRVGTCEPVVAELYRGMELSATRDENMKRLERGLSRLVCWPFDRPASREYGRIGAELKRRGRPMQQIDVMLAAVALSLGDCTVVTTDSDLSAVPGLSTINWMTE